MARQINDLEAVLNTSIITERSVRKAQDKNLAEELDKLRKDINGGQLSIPQGQKYDSVVSGQPVTKAGGNKSAG